MNRYEALYDISRKINALKEMEPLLGEITSLVVDALGAERGFIVLNDEDRTIRAAKNMEDPDPHSNTVVERVMAGGEPLMVYDADQSKELGDAQSIILKGVKSVLAVPLVLKGDSIGAIYVDTTKRRVFEADDLEFLEAFSNLAALAVENTRLYERLIRENIVLRKKLTLRDMEIVGNSRGIQEVLQLTDRFATSRAPVLIVGETGTGKELFARRLHALGPTSKGAFVPVNCGAIPDNLLESELFGYKKGAFTGAVRDKAGLIEESSDGTLFLDEITELPQQLQVKLLRFLQDGEMRRLGDVRTRTVQTRVVSASNQPLETPREEGKFREDLFFRLSVLQIHIPPLRDRRDDIPLLAEHFVRKYSKQEGKRIKRINRKALEVLMGKDWPGNVRELENAVARAVVLADGTVLKAEHFTPGPAKDPLTLEELERRHVEEVLSRFNGNRTKAAKALGITLRGLQYKLKRWDHGG
jgi:Nif-specific regulatory protein